MRQIPEVSTLPETGWKAKIGKHIPAVFVSIVCVLFLFAVDTSLFGTAVALFAVVATVVHTTQILDAKVMLPMEDKAVLITGCDTGFGNWLASGLAQQGVTVYAGCLNKDGDGACKLKSMTSPGRVHVMQMDVTSDEQVKQCVQYVREQQDQSGFWGVVNNAGLNTLGDIELTTMEQFTRVANINQLGMVRVTKAFLPLIRKTQGRIVNVTSVRGRMSTTFVSAYNMTKYAGETFSDILRMEMKQFGVKVSIVEPCHFGGATGCLYMPRIRQDFESMWESMDDELRQTYGREYLDFHVQSTEDSVPGSAFNVYPVLQAMTHALFAEKPKARYLVAGGSGWIDMFRLRALLMPFLPEWLMDWWVLSDIEGFFPKPKALTRPH